jgi:xanthine permease XanP
MPAQDTKLLYGVGDRVPPLVCALQALQHIAVMVPPLVYPILVLQAAGAGLQATIKVVSASFIALGIGTVLQCYPGKYIGSGFLLPFIFTAAYLPASLLAVKAGGMPLVIGMTLFAGATQIALGWIVPRARWLFPAEISGLCITLIALVLAILGIRLMFGGDLGHEWRDVAFPKIGIGIATLALIIILQIWGGRSLQTYAVIVSVIAGYLVSVIFGIVDGRELSTVAEAQIFQLPQLSFSVPTFRIDFVVPFAVAALACCLRAMGDLTMCQKINNRDWVRPDFVSIQRGVFADGLGTVVSVLIGSVGGNTYSTSVGLSSATRIASRQIGFFIGVVLICLAAFPKLLAVLVSVPKPIMGAALVFTACFVLINGLKIVMDRVLDSRRIVVVGLALTLSISRDVFPEFYDQLPTNFQPFVMSDLVIGVIVALVLNALFRLGIKQRESLAVEPGPQAMENVQSFLEEQGAVWSARRDVMARAIFGTLQTLEVVSEQIHKSRPIIVQVTFDEYNLDITVFYEGEPIELSEKRPSDSEILESEMGERRLAGYLIRRNADRVEAVTSATGTTIKLHFDH